MAPEINYQFLADSINFYKKNNFNYIDVPWMVSKSAILSTFENNCFDPPDVDKHLVGSAEQSFCEMIMANNLNYGNYIAITPCFRKSDYNRSEFHFDHFIKSELIIYDKIENLNKNTLINLILLAQNFFISSGATAPEIIETFDGFDINNNGLEIGSYGIRIVNNFSYIYGTAIAEPRFSMSLKIK